MTRSRPHHALLLALGVAAAACGGGGPSGGTPVPSPTTGSSPCDSALARSAGLVPDPLSARSAKRRGGLGSDVRDPRDFIWNHRIASRDRAQAAEQAGLAADVGDIAVLQDDGSVISSPNTFDLAGVGLRFQRNTAGGYDVSRADATFRATLGGRLSLADDDGVAASIPFAFPFYGGSHSALFVNSDGNLTFGQSDTASTERGLGRVLSGAPRVAPFFGDLDPSAGGGVFADPAADAFTVTWCRVPGFESTATVTTQAILFRDGTIEIKFASVSLPDAIVALSPGRTETFVPLDLSAAAGAAGSAALGERFRAEAELDLVTASRRFLSTHADDYDQLAFWTDARVVGDQTFAFQSTINNSIRGIGKEIINFSGEYGSGGRLQGLVVMDNLGKYPNDPRQKFLGEDSTVSLLGQETGHRWLAFLRFRDGSQDSNRLLGRDDAHWSFFFDSDASVMEGNDIEDLGGGSFRTVGAVQRYGPLDLYAMGLIRESDVRPVFFVDSPFGTTRQPDSSPATGASFNGTRREVTIGQIVQAMGTRQPSSAQSPRVHREAFVYIVGRGRTADPAAVAKLERIRQAWVGFFSEATGNRMRLDTSLR